jgi:hypothetical protein
LYFAYIESKRPYSYEKISLPRFVIDPVFSNKSAGFFQ